MYFFKEVNDTAKQNLQKNKQLTVTGTFKEHFIRSFINTFDFTALVLKIVIIFFNNVRLLYQNLNLYLRF